MPRHHKTLPRLYVSHDLTPDATLPLDKDQSNYLVNVMRRKQGDEVVVFNGRDGAWLARVGEASKRNAVLELVEHSAEQPARTDLWYGFAPLKTGRLDYMIQKATEMGASTLQPVMTQHTQAKNIRQDKMRANAIEAAEQCEVLQVPEVRDEVALKTLIANWRQDHGERRLIFADESAGSASPINTLEPLDQKPLGLLIGPEGGFSDEERALLLDQDFVTAISLGPRILRADTAAVAALAVIQATIGDWR